MNFKKLLDGCQLAHVAAHATQSAKPNAITDANMKEGGPWPALGPPLARP